MISRYHSVPPMSRCPSLFQQGAGKRGRMQTLVKRIAANELGHTGGHQRGGVLIPKGCVRFFPSLGTGANPEQTIDVYFPGKRHPVTLRLIYYNQGTRDEYRLTPVPHDVLRSTKAGDYILLKERGDGTYMGVV